MNRIVIFLLLVCGVAKSFAADSYQQLWQKGNRFYQDKQYDSALGCFEKIAQGQPKDASIYYNLGNTYYRLNNVGMAVLNYQRALRIDPDNKDAADNLMLAESRINNRIQAIPNLFFVKWWKSATKGSNAGVLSVVSLVLFLLFIGGLLLKRLKNPDWLRPQLLVGVVCVWAVFLLLSFKAAGNATAHDMAVVMDNDAPLSAAPQAKAQSYIPEGTTVEVVSEKAGYIEIRLPDGRRGWMQGVYLNKI